MQVLYCHCAYAQVLPKEVKDRVLFELCSSGVTFEAVPDLCQMSAQKDPSLGRLARVGTLRVAACYPRAVQWLFQAAGVKSPENCEVLNMRAQTAEDIISALLNPELPSAPADVPVGRVPLPGALSRSTCL